jgi:hypothetical protein
MLGDAQHSECEIACPPMHRGSVGVTEFTGPIPFLQNAPRTVIGYHVCSQEAADRIFVEQQFIPSTRAYDWLGEGFYFWEYAPSGTIPLNPIGVPSREAVQPTVRLIR